MNSIFTNPKVVLAVHNKSSPLYIDFLSYDTIISYLRKLHHSLYRRNHLWFKDL